MEPGSTRIPATAGIPFTPQNPAPSTTVIVANAAWRRLLRNPEAVVARAARAAGMPAIIVLSSDTEVKRLNARHRGRNKPTNVLTFDPAARGQPGEIVLALGTVRREAREAGRRLAHHLAHLVVHGSLHLQGHDHHGAGEARRMEMAESRIMGRMGLPNPWKRA
jgi:probable rRNA maturation factor